MIQREIHFGHNDIHTYDLKRLLLDSRLTREVSMLTTDKEEVRDGRLYDWERRRGRRRNNQSSLQYIVVSTVCLFVCVCMCVCVVRSLIV